MKATAQASMLGVSFAVLALAAPAGAAPCDVDPGTDAARRACLERACGDLPEGGKRARCVAAVYQTWETVSGCAGVAAGPARERCIADALRDRTIREAVARVDLQQLIASTLAYVNCRHGGGSPQSCFGLPPKLSPFPPPDPYLASVLADLKPNERGGLFKSLSAGLDAHLAHQKAFLKETFAAAEGSKPN